MGLLAAMVQVVPLTHLYMQKCPKVSTGFGPVSTAGHTYSSGRGEADFDGFSLACGFQ